MKSSRLVSALSGLCAVLHMGTSSADVFDVVLSTSSVLRNCPDIVVPGGRCTGGQDITRDSPQPDLGVTGSISARTVDPDDPRTNAATSIGFQGPALLPAISGYAYAYGLRRYTNPINGFQRYVFGPAGGTITLTGRLTYSHSGQERELSGEPSATSSRGRVNGSISAFTIAGGVLDTDLCNLTNTGLYTDTVALLSDCQFYNGQEFEPIPGFIVEFTGYQELGRVSFDTPDGPVSNGVATAQLTITGAPNQAVFIAASMGIFAHLNGFGDTRSTLLITADDPTLIQPTAVIEPTFVLAPPAGPEVGIDIRPFVSVNKIYPRFGLIPVAIFGSETLDALQIDPATLEFGPSGSAALPWLLQGRDINHDGFADIVATFRASQAGILCGDDEATVTGRTYLGEPFNGTDSVAVIGCSKRMRH